MARAGLRDGDRLYDGMIPTNKKKKHPGPHCVVSMQDGKEKGKEARNFMAALNFARELSDKYQDHVFSVVPGTLAAYRADGARAIVNVYHSDGRRIVDWK